MVPAAVKDIAQRSVLHNLPGIDDGHFVTRLRNHPQIMGNHDYAGFVFSLKVTDHRQYLRLYGNVKGGRRFIRD